MEIFIDERSLLRKIKDNKLIILNIVNKRRLHHNYLSKLLNRHQLDGMIKKLMKKQNITMLQATEILKQQAKDEILK